MEERYLFRPIREEEVPLMFQMILDRMQWMDAVGIQQWNKTKYDQVYPLTYYQEKRAQGEVYALEDTQTGEMVCAAVLKHWDARWSDAPPALYLRNFVSKIGTSGVGRIFVKRAEQLAVDMGKQYFRLDSAEANVPLSRYYEEMGFLPVGSCVDGLYRGTLREKSLVPEGEMKSRGGESHCAIKK